MTFDWVKFNDYNTPYEYFVNEGDDNIRVYCELYKKYAEQYKLKSVCELGVYQGTSTSAWIAGGVEEIYGFDAINVIPDFLLDKWKLSCDFSLTMTEDAANYSGCPDVDAILFDIPNSYQSVKRQLSSYSKHAKRFMFVHSILYPTERSHVIHQVRGNNGHNEFIYTTVVIETPAPGTVKVGVAVDEFLAENKDWRLLETVHLELGGGMAILERIN